MTESQRKKPQLSESWLEILGDEFDKPYMDELRAFLREEMKKHKVYPPGSLMFNALNVTPFEKARVIILGQDPYHGPNQAHGLSFSVQRGVKPPPSLQNIFQELNNSLGVPIPKHGDLTSWAEQGVLLLNTTLSVRARSPKSHAGKGWEEFTDRIIDELNEKREGLVFVLWGSHAGKKATRIDQMKHLVLRSAHPSPYSADRGFFGCNHFSIINEHLERRGETPINWELPR
ncbi:MAG: uracil-DNA glycosylase [Deltaproteobacteria bacterium]|nr:uracil-DNA glycosylase [Deltaproteobacteria bacterium]MBU50322.1 uracil-DNA glycosylase [Deltaproteobacteria bacterium]|tara:strand:- start:8069 stop:8761 length:693 start_codon:yes stop_codon:yes gene_type:complete